MSIERKQEILDEWYRRYAPSGGEKKQMPDVCIAYVDEDIMILTDLKDLVDRQTLRLKTNTIAICFKGRLQATCQGERIEIEENDLFILPSGMICNDVMVSPDFEFTVMVMSDQCMQSFLRSNMEIWTKLVYVEKRFKIRLNEPEMQYQRLYQSLMKVAFRNESNLPMQYHKELIHSLLRSVVIAVCLFLTVNRNKQTPGKELTAATAPRADAPKETLGGTGRGGILFNQFIGYLQQSPVKHLTVKEVAKQLCITPKYLTVLCLKHSGKTASDWIEEYTISEIVYYLRASDLSVKEIAQRIGFSSPSFFGKYVREHLHLSPQRYRAALHRSDAGAESLSKA